MYLWLDPPGDDPGWIYGLETDEDYEKAIAAHDIPADNAATKRAYDDHAERAQMKEDEYQKGRDFWGITTLVDLPTDLPDKIKMVGK